MKVSDKSFIGHRCGNLTVVGRAYTIGHSLRWKCLCDCGNLCFHTKGNILKGTLRSCGCIRIGCRGSLHKNWKGAGLISSSFVCHIKSIALRRGIPFKLNAETLEEIRIKQSNKCALSGIPLSFPQTHKDAENKMSYNASLDRINSHRGYVVGNVQWVTKNVNMMKQKHTNEEFVRLCNEIVNFNKEKTCVS